MFFAYLGIYILVLLFIWSFFVIAKIHAYKFKNFSLHIENVSNLLFIFLLILSVLGFFLVFQLTDYTPSVSTSTNTSKTDIYY